jgi:hypothetical protein
MTAQRGQGHKQTLRGNLQGIKGGVVLVPELLMVRSYIMASCPEMA